MTISVINVIILIKSVDEIIML